MPDLATALLLVYAAGVAVGLAATDAGPGGRLALALLWPLGPLAFVVTLGVLLAASLIAFPIVGAVVLLLAALAYYSLFSV